MLADEINRASPRTQSAMLEAMQEKNVTMAGKVHMLPEPFMVFATQNPFESEGTYPLPEAQMDRFLIHSLVDYPEESAENCILEKHANNELVGETKNKIEIQTLSPKDISMMLNCARSVHINEQLITVINELVRSTRPNSEKCPEDFKKMIWYGASPRAGISLISVAKSLALIEGDEQVSWQHIKRMAKPVLRHRVKLINQAIRDNITSDNFIDNITTIIEDKYSNLIKGL